jgi:hypothetical protein
VVAEIRFLLLRAEGVLPHFHVTVEKLSDDSNSSGNTCCSWHCNKPLQLEASAPSKPAGEQATLADVQGCAGAVHDVGVQGAVGAHVPYAHLAVDAWCKAVGGVREDKSRTSSCKRRKRERETY